MHLISMSQFCTDEEDVPVWISGRPVSARKVLLKTLAIAARLMVNNVASNVDISIDELRGKINDV